MHATRHSCAVIVVVAIALYADAVVRRWLSFYDTLTPACAVQLAFSWSAVEDGHVVCRATDTEQLYTVQPDFLQRLAALPSIPRIVHISWKNSSAPPQGVFGRLCGAVPLMSGSPGWRVRLYNDTDIANYLRAVLPARDARLVLQRHIVEQVDLWRLLVILHEGGVYMDADRWVTVPLDRVVPPRARMLLPTSYDRGPSQAFMASAPGNPVFEHAVHLNLQRRRAGGWGIYALGPVTWEHAVARVVFGAHNDSSRAQGAPMRAAMRRGAARELMATLRESPPCLTETADVSGLACVVLWQFYRRSKQETYRRLGMTRWTSWRPLERKEPPSHNGSRAPKPAP